MIKRTNKLFDKNLPEDFVRMAMSIGGLNSIPLNTTMYQWEDFSIEERYRGVKSGLISTPWKDEMFDQGYEKELYLVKLKLKGFDTHVNIFQNGRLDAYFHSSDQSQFGCNSIDWVNLLLEHGFVEMN